MTNNYKQVFFLLLLLLPMLLVAQNKQLQSAEKAYKVGDYYTAARDYRIALNSSTLKISPAKRANYQYKCAESNQKIYNYDRAEQYYGKVAVGAYANIYPDVEYYYALSLKRNGKYKESIAAYKKFQANPSSNKEVLVLQELSEHDLKGCYLAQELIANANGTVQIDHMGDAVNTQYSDFSPHLVGDDLYYSSLIFERELVRGRAESSGPNISQNLVGKVIVAKNKGTSRSVQLNNENINTKYENSGNSNVNLDGSVLYFCKCKADKDRKMICKIYRSTLDDKEEWGEAIMLPTSINMEGYTATQPAIGWDSTLQKEVLFYVSDRPDGQGDKDIWAAEIIGENQFGEPYNLGTEINSKGDEISPFFHTSKQTLYYSSDYIPGLGGFDIFYTHRVKGDYTEPVNVGIPLNSAANDLYFIINPDDSTGFFSSNRPGSTILTGEACCNDIYALTLPILPTDKPLEIPIVAEIEPQPVPELPSEPVIAIAELEVNTTIEETTIDSLPKEIAVQPIPKVSKQRQKTLDELNKLLPLSLYFHNDMPKNTTTPYTSTFDDYMGLNNAYKENHLPQYNKSVQPQVADNIDDFFDIQVKGNYGNMQEFFRQLVIAVKNGFKLEVSIQGFTSPRASADYNKKLAAKRIASVKIDLLNYQNGVLKSYINDGHLVIKELPLGEAQAPAGISDAINDPRNSVYSVEAASQRKVNFMVVGLQSN